MGKTTLKALLAVLLVVGIATIGASVYYTNQRIDKLESKLETQKPQVVFETVNEEVQGNDNPEEPVTSVTTSQQVKFECDAECQSSVKSLVDKYLENNPTEVVTKTVSAPILSTTTVSYVPMSAFYSTTSTDWVDVPGSAVYLDVAGDYGSSSTVTWEVSLKVNHGNGRAYARIWDDTNKVSPNNSEVYSENNADYTTKISQPISMWNGNNLYKVQVKSLNATEVFINGAKFKIVH
ncbi:hypothetical protein ACFL2C_03795 [Patescibacteria group bacterium]